MNNEDDDDDDDDEELDNQKNGIQSDGLHLDEAKFIEEKGNGKILDKIRKKV